MHSIQTNTNYGHGIARIIRGELGRNAISSCEKNRTDFKKEVVAIPAVPKMIL
jgi:hypothetical protein